MTSEQLRAMFPPDEPKSNVVDLAAVRRMRETAQKLRRCLVCGDPAGVQCCEYGRER